MANIKTVTDATFQADVLGAEAPVLVDFWAPWCGPCRIVGPVLEQLAAQYAGRVEVVKLNVDESPRTAERYSIRSIPTIALFKGGEMVDGVVGSAALPRFRELLDKHLESVPVA